MITDQEKTDWLIAGYHELPPGLWPSLEQLERMLLAFRGYGLNPSNVSLNDFDRTFALEVVRHPHPLVASMPRLHVLFKHKTTGRLNRHDVGLMQTWGAWATAGDLIALARVEE